MPINGRAFPISTSVEPIDGRFHIVNLPVIVTGSVNISPDAAEKRAVELPNRNRVVTRDELGSGPPQG
ncbi:hypothetical protein AB0H34_43340 [Saccharopolyspora shandongensis]|uniref:hypothetical protein n=1 Tax=Saccharopolyspora shandongensis TaxID=418495 RepID=UPI0033C11C9A